MYGRFIDHATSREARKTHRFTVTDDESSKESVLFVIPSLRLNETRDSSTVTARYHERVTRPKATDTDAARGGGRVRVETGSAVGPGGSLMSDVYFMVAA